MTAAPAQIDSMQDKSSPHSSSRKKPWAWKAVKAFATALVVLIVLLFVAQMFWRFSGTNRWELVLEKNGIKVYSLKAPGSELVQFRGIGRIHSNLAGVVAWMQDADACKVQGCTESYTLEKVGETLQYNYFQYDYSPFGKRDFVIRSLFYQNPNTKEVLLTVAGLADRVPQRDGFIRVTNLNNKWRLTPLGNGDIEVEIENNLDPGGWMPAVMFNSRRPMGMYRILTRLQSWVSKDKYQNAKFAFITEEGINPSAPVRPDHGGQ